MNRYNVGAFLDNLGPTRRDTHLRPCPFSPLFYPFSPNPAPAPLPFVPRISSLYARARAFACPIRALRVFWAAFALRADSTRAGCVTRAQSLFVLLRGVHGGAPAARVACACSTRRPPTAWLVHAHHHDTFVACIVAVTYNLCPCRSTPVSTLHWRCRLQRCYRWPFWLRLAFYIAFIPSAMDATLCCSIFPCYYQLTFCCNILTRCTFTFILRFCILLYSILPDVLPDYLRLPTLICLPRTRATALFL